MVTYRHGASGLLVLGGLCVLACGAVVPVGGPPAGDAPEAPVGTPGRATGTYVPGSSTPRAKYPGHGFVVHEWGTNTIVVGSDGSMQRGLHHEEEDLPDFVYDRIKAGGMTGSVEVKMETPVLYFYAEQPRDVDVTVTFPAGVMTQWYPSARGFSPMIAQPAGAYADPVMDPRYVFQLDVCAQRFSDGKAIKDGRLDWGTVHVGARGETPAAPDAPIDRYTWGHARAVDANPVRVPKPGTTDVEQERFLFYRGLGNFTLPVSLLAEGPQSLEADGVTLVNHDPKSALGSVFVLNVGPTSAKFAVHPEGVPVGPGAFVETLNAAPDMPLDAYESALAAAMTAELDKTGLYHDEAVGMVSTWRRQWFKTPGLRVLYLAPQAWTDAQIPLSLAPAPDELTRVMVIRTEVITRAQEDSDVLALADVNAADATRNAAGAGHFRALGRFAEPRLRRARQLAFDADGSRGGALLAEIAGANTDFGVGE
jgi:hypothetical protein